MKTCSQCGETKAKTEFYVQRPNGLSSACKICVKKQRHDYYRKNKAKILARKTEYREANRDQINARQNARWAFGDKELLERIKKQKARYYRAFRKRADASWINYDRGVRHKYGITAEDVERMLIEQRGLCACCNTPIPMGKMRVDHCHTHGTVRGLLCHRCNITLGNVELIGVHNVRRYLMEASI